MIVNVASLVIFAHLVAAHSTNGMDMSMDGAMNMTMGTMVPWLHFTIGADTLWFMGWVPSSVGAMIGACIGLVLLAIFDRWLAACRSLLEAHWRKRAQIAVANRLNGSAASNAPAPGVILHGSPSTPDNDIKEKAGLSLPTVLFQNLSSASAKGVKPTLNGGLRTIAPFIPSHDITRGVLYAVQSALGLAFMLSAMTFQAGFIISICVGLGIGEMFFGRYASHTHLY